MPGKKITDHQVHKYKHHRNTLTQVAAAARAGLSERSARRIDDSDALPSQQSARSWRTRADPLSVVWCRRRFQVDPPCRSQLDPGMGAGVIDAGCG